MVVVVGFGRNTNHTTSPLTREDPINSKTVVYHFILLIGLCNRLGTNLSFLITGFNSGQYAFSWMVDALSGFGIVVL